MHVARLTFGLACLAAIVLPLTSRSAPSGDTGILDTGFAPEPVADVVPYEPVAKERPGEDVYNPEIELLGTWRFDRCQLIEAFEDDIPRADYHVRTGYIADERMPELLDLLDDGGMTGLHLGFFTSPSNLDVLTQYERLAYLSIEGDDFDDYALEPLQDLQNLVYLDIGVRPYEWNDATDDGPRAALTEPGPPAVPGPARMARHRGTRVSPAPGDVGRARAPGAVGDPGGRREHGASGRDRVVGQPVAAEHPGGRQRGGPASKHLPNLRVLDLATDEGDDALGPHAAGVPGAGARRAPPGAVATSRAGACASRGLWSDEIGWMQGNASGCENWDWAY